MKEILFRKIRRASSKYVEFRAACGKIAKEAQKHIDWNDDVSCDFYPSDGICIEIDGNVCPATRFFELPEIIGNDKIDKYAYKINCI